MPQRIDELFWELSARTEKLDRQLKGAQQQVKRAGERSAEEFLKGLEQRFAVQRADVREAVARRLIDPRTAARQGRAAAEAFDRAVLDEIKRRAVAGTLTDQDFVRLTDSLKVAGQEGGRQFDEGMRSELARMPRWLRTVFAGGIIAGITFITRRIVGLFRSAAEQIQQTLERAGRVEQIERAFRNIATARGVSPGELLAGLRQATRGMIDDLRLIQQANVALQSGLPATVEDLSELAFVARRLAEAVGRDATEAFTRLTNGIAKGEQNILEELGLLVRMEDALKAWERQTGRNSDSLSQQQKILVFYNAVMEEARRKVADVGDESFDAGKRLDQLRTFIENVRNAAAESVAESPRLVQFLEDLGSRAEDSADRVERLGIRIGALADVILDLGAAAAASPILRALLRGIPGVQGMQQAAQVTVALARGRFDEHVARREREARLEAIRNEGDILKLLKMREDLTSEVTDDLERQLDIALELEAVNERIVQLSDAEHARRARARGTGDEGPDEQTLRQREQLMRQLEDQLAQLTATAVDEARLELDRLERAFVEAFGGRIPAAAREGLRRLREDLDVTEALEGRRRELALFEISVPTETVQRALEEFMADLSAERDTLQKGSTAREKYNDLLREAGELYARIAKDVQDLKNKESDRDKQNAKAREEEIRRLREQAREIEQVARGVLQLADAFGVLDHRARQALEAIVQIGANVPAALAGDPGSILSVLGGVAQLIDSLVEGDDEGKRLLRENNERLQELARELRGMTITTDELIQAQRALAEAQRRDLLRTGVRSSRGTSLNVEGILELLESFGLTISDVDRIADDFGINIRDKAGRLIPEALAQLLAALDESVRAIVGFNDSLEAQRERVDTEAELLDLPDTPEARLQRDLELLQRFAPELVKAFGLDQIDLSTPEGRARLNDLINLIFKRFAEGTLSPELLGQLSRSDFLDFLRRLDESLDEITEEEAAAEAGQGFAVARGIKEIQANKLIAQGETHSFLLGGILEQEMAIHELLRRSLQETGVLTPPELPPPTAAFTGAGTSVSIGSVIGELRVESRDGIVDQAALETAMRRAAEDLVEQVDRAIQRRRDDERRAFGR